MFIYYYSLIIIVRLQKQLSRKVGTEEYAKWVVVIPPDKIKELGWKEGIELDFDSKESKLVLKPKKE
jgi:hypothetical protein